MKRELKEKSFNTREALTMAIELCESQDEINIAIKLLKSKPSTDDMQAMEDRFQQIATFIKENLYGAKYCYHCQKWFFEDDYREDFNEIYRDDKDSCIFCILDGSAGDSGIDFDF